MIAHVFLLECFCEPFVRFLTIFVSERIILLSVTQVVSMCSVTMFVSNTGQHSSD